MKDKHLWQPSKFIRTKRGYRASRNPKEVFIGSRFFGDVQARVYESVLRQHASGLLLDLGCGMVPLYDSYRDRVSDTICVDWPNSTHKSRHVDFEVDLNGEIPLASNQFDTILATDVLEHISNPDLLWREIARLLKPEGKVIIGVPFFYRIHEAPYDYYRYTEHMLRLFCERNALEVVSLNAYGGVPEIMADLIAKNIAFSKTLSSVHLLLSGALVECSPVRRMSLRTSKTFPLGYCLVARKGHSGASASS